MNTLPIPPDTMQQLDWFIGQWAVFSRSLQEDGSWLEENMRAEHSTILGGHVIFEHFNGPLLGQPFEAWSLRKFNPQADHWEQRWVDTTPSGFADWTGAWDADSQTFTGYANRGRSAEGVLNEKAAREVFFEIEPARFQWKYERTINGGQTWEIAWTLDYTRIE
jgi:hypothetical protein